MDLDDNFKSGRGYMTLIHPPNECIENNPPSFCQVPFFFALVDYLPPCMQLCLAHDCRPRPIGVGESFSDEGRI